MSIFRNMAKKHARPWFISATMNLAALYLIYRLAKMFMKAASHKKIQKRKVKIKV